MTHVTPDHDDETIGQVISRREALSLFTAPFLLSLAGCSSSAAADELPMVGSCVVQPQLTEGPFYVDTGLVRADIRDGKAGVQLDLNFNVSAIDGDTCTPLENAIVDIWHADADGDYSGVGSLANQQFLRGIQQTDAEGNTAFTTIYPGWYPGRAVHIHFKVRSSASSGSSYEFTSQLFFDDDLSRQVYQQSPYSTRGSQNTTNDRDGIYRNGGAQLLLDVSEAEQGYAASFEIALLLG